jgi:predicted DNA-binding transcriptional regulator AlpA
MLGQSRSSLYRAINHGEAPFPVYKIGTFRIPPWQSKGCSAERRRHAKRAEP